MVLLM
jgi:hypothetical protein